MDKSIFINMFVIDVTGKFKKSLLMQKQTCISSFLSDHMQRDLNYSSQQLSLTEADWFNVLLFFLLVESSKLCAHNTRDDVPTLQIYSPQFLTKYSHPLNLVTFLFQPIWMFLGGIL